MTGDPYGNNLWTQGINPRGLTDKARRQKRSAIRRRTSDGTKPGGNKSKLTQKQCDEAIKMSRNFKTNISIARHFGVTEKVIKKVLDGTYTPRKD